MTGGELRIEWMRLDDIREAERNSKAHDLDELEESVRALGFVTQLRYDERVGRLYDGHGRLADLRRLRDRGAAAPEGIRDLGDDWAAPVVRGWRSRDGHHATAVAIATNAVGKAAGFHDGVLYDELAELAADAPELLRATAHTSEDLDRLAQGATFTDLDGLATVLHPDDSDRARAGGDRDERGGDLDDVGRTAEEDGPGPLDVEPAWRTLHPLRARYHDGTPDGADRVARWLRERGASDVHVQPDLTVMWRGGDGTDLLIPGKWVTWFRGRLDVMTREELDEEFVPANEPARRAARDAKPVRAT